MLVTTSKIFFSLVVGLLVVGDGEAEQSLTEVKEDIEKTLSAFPLGGIFRHYDFNFVELFLETVKCTKYAFKDMDMCNYNLSFNPFKLARECSKKTGFLKTIDAIQNSLPQFTLKIGVPVFESQSRCFNPSALFHLTNILPHAGGADILPDAGGAGVLPDAVRAVKDALG